MRGRSRRPPSRACHRGGAPSATRAECRDRDAGVARDSGWRRPGGSAERQPRSARRRRPTSSCSTPHDRHSHKDRERPPPGRATPHSSYAPSLNGRRGGCAVARTVMECAPSVLSSPPAARAMRSRRRRAPRHTTPAPSPDAAASSGGSVRRMAKVGNAHRATTTVYGPWVSPRRAAGWQRSTPGRGGAPPRPRQLGGMGTRWGSTASSEHARRRGLARGTGRLCQLGGGGTLAAGGSAWRRAVSAPRAQIASAPRPAAGGGSRGGGGGRRDPHRGSGV